MILTVSLLFFAVTSAELVGGDEFAQKARAMVERIEEINRNNAVPLIDRILHMKYRCEDICRDRKECQYNYDICDYVRERFRQLGILLSWQRGDLSGALSVCLDYSQMLGLQSD